MIDNRGIIKLGASEEPAADDVVVIIDAFDEVERQRAHQLMTENWQLVAITRRRSDDGSAYTEYQLRAPKGGRVAV